MRAKPSFNPRLQAIAAVREVLDQGHNLTDCSALQAGADARDVALARHLAYGMVRWLTALDWLASRLLDKPLKQRDSDIHHLILLGIHQLWQDRTPAHAAINETAQCARVLGKPWAVGLINAILRRFQREQGPWLQRLDERPERLAHPRWLMDRVQQDWPEDWQTLLTANNQPPPLWLRLNRQAATMTAVMERLTDQGFQVCQHPCSSAADALSVHPAAHVAALPGFAQGYFSVQDPAAQLAVELLQAGAGMRVLDACAAPGGKACHVLERTAGVQVTAVERHPQRVKLIRENLTRLKLNCQVITADATEPATWWDGTLFQRVLIDAPCSASGVIRRHPEIKHLRKPGQIDDAIALQQRLLQQLWPLLEPGGILVYATCSVLRAENGHQIRQFLEQHADAIEQQLAVHWGRPQAHGRQILPGEQDMDGFYYAVVHKAR